MSTELNQSNKQLVWEFWQALESATPEQTSAEVSKYLTAGHVWHGPDPIDVQHGADAWERGFWQPLRQSIPDLSRETHIFFGGQSNGHSDGLNDGHMWVCGTGYFNGTFASDYLTIPASNEKVSIRWGEFCRIEQGRIVETYFLLDLVDLMQQAGFQVLPPSRGTDNLYPAPLANDGIMFEAQDEKASEYTLNHIRRFIFDALNSYDQSELKSMGIADYFHPHVQWYGPGGIGACLSLREFEEKHQQHWLRAFPDRQVQDLNAIIAEGSYSGAPGWAGVIATHTGKYLDCPATNNSIEFNGLDFWKLENDVYIENWVFVDMIHMFRQIGIDLFERLRQQGRQSRQRQNQTGSPAHG